MTDKKLSDDIPSTYVDKFNQLAKETWKHEDFRKHLLKTIEDSDKIKSAIKQIVWQAIKDKVVWLIIGGVVLCVMIFAKDFIAEFAKISAQAVTK